LPSRPIESLSIGDAAETTRTISQDDITRFAEISGDFNPVHLDADYARNTQFGRTIAHGPIALALAAGLLGMELPGVGSIAISNVIRYRKPIFAGDTVTTRVEVTEINAERRRVTLAMTWTNPDGVVVADGEAVLRPPASTEG
jgi:3-hydroxybutyryl-CoA dehydratase